MKRSDRKPPGWLVVPVYTFSVPFDGWTVLGGRSPTFYAGLLLVARLLLASLGKEPRPRIMPPRELAPMLALIFFATLSSTWSRSATLTTAWVTTLFLTVLITIALVACMPPVISRAVSSFQLGAVVVAAMLLVSPVNEYGRRSAAGDPNAVSAMLTLAIAVALGWQTRDRFASFTRAATVLTCSVAVLASGSRAGALGLIGVLAIYVIVKPAKPGIKLVRLAGVGAAAYAVIFVAQMYGWLPERVAAIGDEIAGGTLSNRTVIWNFILNQDVSVIGVGAGATPAYLANHLGYPAVAHNVPLGVWYELGLIGSAIAVWLAVVVVRSAKHSPLKVALILAAPSILAVTMTLSLETSRYLWFVIALALLHAPNAEADGSAIEGRRRQKVGVPL